MKRIICIVAAVAVLAVILTGCTKESTILYDSELLKVERAGNIITISDLESDSIYTLKLVRMKKAEKPSQSMSEPKTISNTDAMHIQIVYDILIVTLKNSNDIAYIKLSK